MEPKKLYEINADETVSRPADFALANGVPATTYVSTLFTSSNTSLMTTVKYPLNTAGTILDRNINVVSSGAFVIPAGFTDLLIRFTGTPTSLTFTDEGITDYGDDLPSESGDYLITVTKTDTDEAFIRVVTMEERS